LEDGMRVNEIALREFLHTSYPRLVAAVALAGGSRAAAEDAVQEALLRAWERSDRGEQVESLDAWVATVALNLSRSALRRLRSERRAKARLRASGWAEDHALSTDRAVDVDRALAGLPRRQREAVVLRYYLQMDTREVATVLRVSEGTVKSTLSRARTALAAALGTDESEEANDRGAG
jgi:RNA polymerase sigma-70 factor (ECF subfamily)